MNGALLGVGIQSGPRQGSIASDTFTKDSGDGITGFVDAEMIEETEEGLKFGGYTCASAGG